MSPDGAPPVLDVVVVAYESAARLPACLTALPRDARVLVADNASSDRGAEIAEALGARVVRNDANLGFAAAANRAAALGDGELVLFLNPDAVVGERDVRLLVEALAGDPRTAAAGPRLLRPDGTEQRAWWPFPSPAATWAEAFGLHRLRRRLPGSGGEVPSVVGACLLVRRDAFEAVGGFDERFWLYGEEADLCRRLWDAGWRVRHVPGAVAVHDGGASGASASDVVFEHFSRGAEHFVAKHHGTPGLVLHRAGLLVGSALRLPVLALRRAPAARTRAATAARLLRVLASRPGRVAP